MQKKKRRYASDQLKRWRGGLHPPSTTLLGQDTVLLPSDIFHSKLINCSLNTISVFMLKHVVSYLQSGQAESDQI